MVTPQDRDHSHNSIQDDENHKRRSQVTTRWLQHNTFAPDFLPTPLQHPLVGYLMAVFLQTIVIMTKLWLSRLFPSLHFTEVFLILVVVLISLAWGAAPGVLAALIGTGLLVYFAAGPGFSFANISIEDAIGTCFYTIAGLTISVLASQTQKARTAAWYAQQQADRRARELEATFDAMTDGVVIYNAQGNMLQINTAYRQLIGLDKNPAHSTLTPAERGAMLALRDEYGHPLRSTQQPVQRMLGGERFSGAKAMDIQMRTLDGRETQLSVAGTPMYNQEHHLTGGVLVFRDVTQRRQLERRTHDALETLLAMADVLVHAPDSTYAHDSAFTARERTALRLVELTCSLLGCQIASIVAVEAETLALRPIVSMGFPAETEQQFNKQIARASLRDYFPATDIEKLYRGEPILTDMSGATAAGMPTYDIRVVLGAPMCVGERLVGFLSVDYNTTEHRYPLNEEMSLITAIGKLAAMVIERERLVQERTEAQAAELAAREANRLKDEFLGIAGHELRTPLTTIKVSVQLAKRQVDRALQQKQTISPELAKTLLNVMSFLKRTERQISIQNRLVSDLLDVSRIETGHLELHPGLYDITAIVREVIDDQRVLTPERTIILSATPPQELLVTVDPDRVHQVISNYLSNALKYSDADKPVVVTVEHSGSRARVAVRDEGPGLSTAEQQHIWDRFYRVAGIEIKSGSGVGLGLGLHISRTLIERLGGKVGVQSEPDIGSTFWFSLPLAEQDDEGANQFALPPPSSIA